MGRLVWEHARPCRPTAASSKHDSGAPASGGERQARRERAAALFAQGRTQAEVARELDVSRQSASRWHAGWQASGATGLQSRGPTGRHPKVADEQLEGIEQALLAGALAHGFATDVWTLDRIAVVIQGLTGVALSNPSVWRLLRNRLGWSVQRPSARPENATRKRSSTGSPRSGRGSNRGRRRIGLACLLRRVGHLADPTGAPQLVPAGTYAGPAAPDGLEAASMAAALGYRPDGTKARLCFHLQPDSYDTDSLIGVLEQLKGFYAGHRVVLVWDGLSAHWSTKLRAHLDAQHHWLRVERLPATPPAQPGRGPVGQPQGRRAGHFAGDSLAEVADQAQQGIQRVCDSDSLVLGFLAHTGLALDEEAVTPR